MSIDSKRMMEAASFSSSASYGPVRVETLSVRRGGRRGCGRGAGRGGWRGARVAHGRTAASPCPRCAAQCTDVHGVVLINFMSSYFGEMLCVR
ncbi:unnamed protein product [Parnassius apollo]|uniref:(apollo) hypothetical protein n=1 Tax=Parnassius apollo TaxID=110799 RepID=A0A8S3X1G6_PARAO|nr:unnamed protein product [Parnassius apollo]